MLSRDSEDKMGCDLCLNLWYDLKRLLWQDELNPRVRCAFGNVSLPPHALIWLFSQILKDINVKHYSREKGLKMGPDNITVWNPIEQVLHEFFQLKFIQVVFWHIAIKKKWYKRQKISLLMVNIFRLLKSIIYWSRWSVDLR